MEKIYLAIILLYVAYKIIPTAWHMSRLYILMGYKRVIINGLPFIIRKLSPLDFIEESQGFSLSFFDIGKDGESIADQMRGIPKKGNKEITEKEIKDKIAMAKWLCEKAVVYFPKNLKADDFFNYNSDAKIIGTAWGLYISIIGHNFPTFKKCYTLKKNYVIHVAQLCAKFGQLPHRHIGRHKGLSNAEAYMIDEFFYTQLLIEENQQIQRQNEAMKKRVKR